MADPQAQTAPDTLPADFFSSGAAQSVQSSQAPPAQAQSAPDTLPADFFSNPATAPGATTQGAPQKNAYDFLGDTIGDTIAGGAEGVGGIIKGAVSNSGAVGAARNAYDAAFNELPPVIKAYETARSQGKGIADALSASNDEAGRQEDARNLFKQRAKEFADNPSKATGKTIVELLALIAPGAVEGLGAGEVGEVAPVTPDVTPDVAPDTAPATETSAAPQTQAPQTPQTPAAPASTPIDAAVNSAIDKSGLSSGTPETTAPAGDDIQPGIQNGIRDVFKDVATDNGVDPQNPTSIRDVGKNTADQILAKSKAAYQTLDEASGGRWQRFDDSLANIREKMQEKSGIDDDEYDRLEQKQNEIETSQANLIDELKTSGKISPELAEEAKGNYKKAQALYDVDAVIKSSTTGRAGVGKGIETVDPNKLTPRLHKLYDSGRLQQGAESHAAEFIDHAENAQAATQAIKNFEPQSATGRNALRNIVEHNTSVKSRLLGGSEGSVDWNGARNDFEKLGDQGQKASFGKDAPSVRSFLNKQAFRQTAKHIILGKSKAGLVIRGAATEEILHHLL